MPIWPRVRVEKWSERQDLNLRTLVPKTSPFSHLRNALVFLYWLRGKDSNPYLLVQSQPSCRLDDPEKRLEETAGLEPATFSFVARCSDSVELRLRCEICTGKDSNLQSCESDSFTDCLLSPIGGRCVIWLFSCQISKVKGATTLDPQLDLA